SSHEEGGGDGDAEIVRDQVGQHLQDNEEGPALGDDQVHELDHALKQQGDEGDRHTGAQRPHGLGQDVAVERLHAAAGAGRRMPWRRGGKSTILRAVKPVAAVVKKSSAENLPQGPAARVAKPETPATNSCPVLPAPKGRHGACLYASAA